MSKKEAAAEKVAEKVAKKAVVHTPKSVKIAAGGNKTALKALAAAHASFEEYRKSGFKGSWWNKSEARAEKNEIPKIRCGSLIRTGRHLAS